MMAAVLGVLGATTVPLLWLRAWRTARRAWAHSVGLHGRHGKTKRHLRWVASALVRPRDSARWFDYLEQREMRPFVAADPRVCFKPMNHYMSARWGWERRLKVSRDSLEFLQAWGGWLRDAMQDAEGGCLAEVPLEGGAWLRLRLTPSGRQRKEGAASLHLEVPPLEGDVSSLAFALERREEGDWRCLIGAVQGRLGGDEAGIKRATKAMAGLRPKALLTVAMQEIAHVLGVVELCGIGNEAHVSRSLRLSTEEQGGLVFDYDAFWVEMGGERRPDGWFRIPLRSPRRDAEHIRPNKRSMYRKRYRILDELERKIRERLAHG